MKLKSLLDAAQDGVRQMTRRECEDMMACLMMEKQKPDMGYPCPESELPLTLRIMDKRLEWVGVLDKVTFACRLFISSICDTPGLAVMWAYTLAHLHEQNPGKKVTLQTFAFAFPEGVPSEQATQKCWDAQKGHAHGVKADNLMDNRDWWLGQPHKA